MSNARVIVFDEPTSSLSEGRRRTPLRDHRPAEKTRAGIIYISHFLEEVRRVAQTYTVLRDGRAVAGGSLAGTEMKSIITQMVGRDLDELFPRVPHEPGEPILVLGRVCASGRPASPASLVLERGEILGIAGLVGAGRTTLLRAMFGLGPVVSGRIRIKHFKGGYAPPRTRIAQGAGFLSEDRKTEGLALGRSIEDNVTYSSLKRHARHGWLRLKERRSRGGPLARAAASQRDRPGPGRRRSLSGGNQQKVALARLLHQQADVLLLDEPTRGIDVGSKAEIYRLIGELAAAGQGDPGRQLVPSRAVWNLRPASP